MTSAAPRPKLGIRTAAFLCAGLLAVGLIAEELAWLSPSGTSGVPADELERPGSLLSVHIKERYLQDPDYGLLNHRKQRGRDWEHPAIMSYYEDGKLEFVSNVGLRLHGGFTRRNERDSINIRLYFRRDYDSAKFRPSTIFGGRRNPIKRLIIDSSRTMNSNGIRWHLSGALAYDIARQIGALAPETHPVSFVFNGNPQGLYILVESVRRTFLESRFGHDNFENAWYHSKRPTQPDDFKLPDPWHRQSFMEVLKGPPPVAMRMGNAGLKNQVALFTLADASHWIDVKSLTRWFVSIVFCATSDPFQAAILRDRTYPDSLWFWVNWDMDHSFTDMYGTAPVPWLHDTFRRTLGRAKEGKAVEAYLIGRLLAEDPAYRDYLVREFLDALNYRLTPAFLDERYRHYRAIAERFGLGDEPYLGILANFLEFRPAHVREQLVRELDLAPLRNVRIEAPRDAAFRIDDHAVTPGFSGWYVPGTEIRVGIEGPAGFSHWIIDGKRVTTPEFDLKVEEEDVVIEASFHS